MGGRYLGRRIASALSGLGMASAWACAEAPPPAEGAALRATFASLAEARRIPTAAAPMAPADRWAPPTAAALAALGGRRFVLEARVETHAGAPEAPIAPAAALGLRAERLALVVDAAGAFALRHALDWQLAGDGAGDAERRCWGDAARWWVAEGAGPIEAVPPLDGEGAACREAPFLTLWAPLRAEAADLRWSAPEPVAAGQAALPGWVADRPVRRLAVTAAPEPERALDAPGRDAGLSGRWTPPDLGLHGRRLGLTATLALDEATGVPLAGLVTLDLAFQKGNRDGRLRWQVRLTSAPAPAPVRLPLGAAATPDRARIEADLRHILGADAAVEASADAGADADLPGPGAAPTLTLEAVGEGDPSPAGPAPSAAPPDPSGPTPSDHAAAPPPDPPTVPDLPPAVPPLPLEGPAPETPEVAP